jgi:hypothetical protein
MARAGARSRPWVIVWLWSFMSNFGVSDGNNHRTALA